MVASLLEACLDDRALVAQPLLGPAQSQGQFGPVMAAEIGEFNALAVVPDALVRVQIGRIAGQALEVQPLGGPASQEVLDGVPQVNRRPVPDHEQLTADRAQQHAQEADNIGRAVGVILRLHKQAPVGRDAADGGEMVMGERHAQDGGLSPWRPGAYGQGQQVEARLVSPDDGPALVGGFFSRAGQRSCHQAWIGCSSRCAARATGRWTLCRSVWSRRLTWAGWYVTPNVRRITSATRLQVQRCPRKPYASGPPAKRAGSCATWSAVSLGVGPGAGWRRKAAMPRSRPRLSHWLTAPGVTPSAAAIAVCFQPCCLSSQARRRRPSRQSSRVVFVLMPPAYHTFTNLYRPQ